MAKDQITTYTFTYIDNTTIHKSELTKHCFDRTLEVRVAVSEDKSAVQDLVSQHEALMEDLDLFFHQGPVSLDSLSFN